MTVGEGDRRAALAAGATACVELHSGTARLGMRVMSQTAPPPTGSPGFCSTGSLCTALFGSTPFPPQARGRTSRGYGLLLLALTVGESPHR